MPITCCCRRDLKLLIFTHEGRVDDEELLSTYRAVFENPDHRKNCSLLIDLRQADSTSRTSQALFELANIARPYYERVPSKPDVAVVAPGNLSYKLARSYEVFSCAVHWTFRVFQEMPAALKWLDVPENILDNPDGNASPQPV